jgi:hypothetical protein
MFFLSVHGRGAGFYLIHARLIKQGGDFNFVRA